MSYTFDFEIVRYHNEQTDEWLTNEQLDNKFEGLSEEEVDRVSSSYEETALSLTVNGSGYYTPARIHGDPNDCYPEDSDYELNSATDPGGYDWLSELTEEEHDEAIGILIDKVRKKDYDVIDEPEDKWASFDRWGY